MKLRGGGGGGGGGLQLVCGRPTLALSSALVPQTLSCLVCEFILFIPYIRNKVDFSALGSENGQNG